MQLNDLPPEVILHLIDTIIDPDDLGSFVLSCHQFHQLASKRLAIHKDHLLRYKSVALARVYRRDDCQDPFALLYDIQQDPAIPWYIRSLTLNPDDLRADDISLEKLRKVNIDSMLAGWMSDSDQRRRFEQVILQALDVSSTRDYESIEKQTQSEGAIFVLVLALSLNVTRIYFDGHLYTYKNSLRELVAATTLWKGEGGAVDPLKSSSSKNPLAKVEYIHIEHWDTELGEELRAIGDLVCLPSLRELDCFAMQDDDNGGEEEDPQQELLTPYSRDSPVTHVKLLHSGLTPASLFRFIRPMIHLEELEYEAGGAIVSYVPEDQTIKEYRDKFVKLAGEWLEERDLVVTTFQDENDDMSDGTLYLRRRDANQDRTD